MDVYKKLGPKCFFSSSATSFGHQIIRILKFIYLKFQSLIFNTFWKNRFFMHEIRKKIAKMQNYIKHANHMKNFPENFVSAYKSSLTLLWWIANSFYVNWISFMEENAFLITKKWKIPKKSRNHLRFQDLTLVAVHYYCPIMKWWHQSYKKCI